MPSPPPTQGESTPTPIAISVPLARPTTPAPTPEPAAVLESGLLKIHVTPWADVQIDGTVVGTTPFRPLSLRPGSYVIRLLNPDYRPLLRKVTIRPGETSVLHVNLAEEAFPSGTKEN